MYSQKKMRSIEHFRFYLTRLQPLPVVFLLKDPTQNVTVATLMPLLLLTNIAIFCIAGVHYVFDTNFARNFSLIESGREFVRRFYDSETNPQAFPMLASACPGELKCIVCVSVNSILCSLTFLVN